MSTLIAPKKRQNNSNDLIAWLEKQQRQKFDWESYKEKPVNIHDTSGDFMEVPPMVGRQGIRNYRLVPYRVMVRGTKGRAPYFSTRWKKVSIDGKSDQSDFNVIPIENYNGDLDVLLDAWKHYINTVDGDKYSLMLPISALQDIIYKHFEGILLSQENRVIGIVSLEVDENDEGRISILSASPYDIQNGNEKYVEDALRSGIKQYTDSKSINLVIEGGNNGEEEDIIKAVTIREINAAKAKNLVSLSGDDYEPVRWVTEKTRNRVNPNYAKGKKDDKSKASMAAQEDSSKGKAKSRKSPKSEKIKESSKSDVGLVTEEPGEEPQIEEKRGRGRPKGTGSEKPKVSKTGKFPLFDTWEQRKDSARYPDSWISGKQLTEDVLGSYDDLDDFYADLSTYFKNNYDDLNPGTYSFNGWIPGSIKLAPDPTDTNIDVLAKGQIETEIGEKKTVYIYTKPFALKQKKAKYSRIARFNENYQSIMDRVKEDAIAGNGSALACWLADEIGIRAGNGLGRDPYIDPVSGEMQYAVGAVNLESQHFRVEGRGKNKRLILEFEGKNLTPWSKEITNPDLKKLFMNRIDPDNPEARIFSERPTHHSASNALYRYIRGDSEKKPGISNGRYSMHDFRTRNATNLANGLVSKVPNRAIDKIGRSDNPTRDLYNLIYDVGTEVAVELVDSVPVALKSYVDPLVFKPWIDRLEKKGINIDIDFDTEAFKKEPTSQSQQKARSSGSKSKRSPRSLK